jgi:hypothetical protein
VVVVSFFVVVPSFFMHLVRHSFCAFFPVFFMHFLKQAIFDALYFFFLAAADMGSLSARALGRDCMCVGGWVRVGVWVRCDGVVARLLFGCGGPIEPVPLEPIRCKLHSDLQGWLDGGLPVGHRGFRHIGVLCTFFRKPI